MIKAKVIVKLLVEAEVDCELEDDGTLYDMYGARMTSDIPCESAFVVEKAPEAVAAAYNNDPQKAAPLFDEAYELAMMEALYQIRQRKGKPRQSITSAFVSPPGGAKA